MRKCIVCPEEITGESFCSAECAIKFLVKAQEETRKKLENKDVVNKRSLRKQVCRLRGVPRRIVQQAIEWQKSGKIFFTPKEMCAALGYRYEQKTIVYKALKISSAIELYISLSARGQSCIKHVYFQPSSSQLFKEYREKMLRGGSNAITGDVLKLPSGESIQSLPLVKYGQLVKLAKTIGLLSMLSLLEEAILENLLRKPAKQLRLCLEKVYLCPCCQEPMQKNIAGNLECHKCPRVVVID